MAANLKFASLLPFGKYGSLASNAFSCIIVVHKLTVFQQTVKSVTDHYNFSANSKKISGSNKQTDAVEKLQ